MKKLCIRLAKTEWSKLCGSEYKQEVKGTFKTMSECQSYLDGVLEAAERIKDKHSINRSADAVQLIITENVRDYYTELFWWISTED